MQSVWAVTTHSKKLASTRALALRGNFATTRLGQRPNPPCRRRHRRPRRRPALRRQPAARRPRAGASGPQQAAAPLAASPNCRRRRPQRRRCRSRRRPRFDEVGREARGFCSPGFAGGAAALGRGGDRPNSAPLPARPHRGSRARPARAADPAPPRRHRASGAGSWVEIYRPGKKWPRPD